MHAMANLASQVTSLEGRDVMTSFEGVAKPARNVQKLHIGIGILMAIN